MTTELLAFVAAGLFISVSLVLWWRASVAARETRRALAQGAKLIDIDTPRDFEAAHLPGSENVPLEDLEALDPRAIGSPDEPIVVYGHGSLRASLAVHELHAKGFHNVLKADYLRDEDAPASTRYDRKAS
jgi:rhodanese-related sulfurtransferase